jgi:hypothetical protein
VARIVVCPHCAAAHRTVGGESRFTCDYCQSVVVLTEHLGVDEAVVPADPAPARAREAARQWLLRKGVHRPEVCALEPRVVPFWHLVARSGEEHTLCAGENVSPLVRGLVLPAAPLVPRGDPRARELDPLPRPSISQEEATRAALATFRDPDPTVASVRLVWLPIVTLRADTPGGALEGIYVAGADKVLFGPLPEGARDAPAERDRLVAFAVFLGIALGVGLLLEPPLLRAAVEIGLVLAGVTAFRSWGTSPASAGRRWP